MERSTRRRMMGDRLASRGLRDLHDSVPSVVGFRGDRGLVDIDRSSDSHSNSSSIRGSRTGVLFVEDRTHRNSISRGKADAFDVGR